MTEIEIPTHCPACNSMLDLVKDQLFCKNSECGAQQIKKVEHFCKTLKIKGMGPATLQKLNILNIIEIYELDKEFLVSILGEKIAEKLVQEIERSKEVSLNTLLPAFGIPLVGNSATKKLCTVVKSIEEISENTCKIAGLGPKTTENLLDWLEITDLSSLPFSFRAEEPNSFSVKGTVCISGRLKSFSSKALAEEELKRSGYEVKGSVTKEVTHLINESGVESAKTKKARDAGIQIITNINELIG
jgi:DNA ligase (NAD+)